MDNVVTDVTREAEPETDADASLAVPVAETGICPGPMTETAGGAEPVAVAETEDCTLDEPETVPVEEASITPGPMTETAGGAVPVAVAVADETDEERVWVVWVWVA